MRTLALIFFLSTAAIAETPVRVGAKHFTEGYILSEIIAQLLESKGISVERIYNLGGTALCFEALKNNEIDVYPEYTGTLSREILRVQSQQVSMVLKDRYGLAIGNSFGFNNTYALVVTGKIPALNTISDLAKFPDLTIGLSYEFMKRQDGWEKLAEVYSLPQQPTGLEHGLAYQALLNNEISVTDCYSTDAEIAPNQLKVLIDDKNFFPSYEAVPLYNIKLDSIFRGIRISITEKEMSAMNALAVYQRMSFNEVARNFLAEKKLIPANDTETKASLDWNSLAVKTLQHLYLTFAALFLAIAVAVPLGIFLYWNPRGARVVLYIAGLLQTIPSIALLAFMIPAFGIGATPAIVALFLYAILPILRNTVNGLQNVDPLLKEVAASLGMSRSQALKHVEGPLALPSMLTGIRVAAVINVGTATLAAFIGAGGLGEYIVTGLALNNTSMIITGAVPAAILALLIEFAFEVIEGWATPAHLRKN